MKNLCVTVLVLAGALASEPPPCRFAKDFHPNVFRDEPGEEYDRYIDHFLRGEAQWIRGIGTDPHQGWTLDGQRLSIPTGLPRGGPHNWTASSKECMQWVLLARILYDTAEGNECRACKIWTLEEAKALIQKKITAYDSYNSRFPGFGGYFPWMLIELATGQAGPDGPYWDHHTPSLDNAELFWPLWATARVLEEYYSSETLLVQGVKRQVDLMLDHGKTLFYNATVPGIRTESFFDDQTKPVAENTYHECSPRDETLCRHYYLDDPYEGELFLTQIAAFPDRMGFTGEQVDALWEKKREKTRKASVAIRGVIYETELGWTFSSHERWKYLMVPYLESQMQKNVFYSGERIRTMYANERNFPGLWGAMQGTTNSESQGDLGYFASVGIPELAMNTPVTRFDIVTPYGAYPVILANESVGMAWIHNMIVAPRGQNCFGTTEGFKIDGTEVSPYVTWDAKVTNVMALIGGVIDITKRYLEKDGVMDDLVGRWDDHWKDFGNLQSIDRSEFEYPEHQIPAVLPDFTSCANNEYFCGREAPTSTEPTTADATSDPEGGGATAKIMTATVSLAVAVAFAFSS